ncbi:DUF6083 domain-containing protein [Streptomyces sp. O3]
MVLRHQLDYGEPGYGHPGRDPVLVGDVVAALTADTILRAARTPTAASDARRPGVTTCGECGGEAAWHRTPRGRWTLIEPGDVRIDAVPAGKRWRIAGDGTAVNLGRAAPSDTCRISHFDVCPGRPAPTGSPVLLAIWRRHATRRAEGHIG